MPLPTINGDQFGYYDIFTLGAASVALTDFQVKKTILWAPHMQSDYADMRFTTLDGTIIPYWIESKTDSVTSEVWLKIPAISVVSNTRVLMYYGNPDVVSASSGNDVFTQFHGTATSDFHDSNVITVPFIYEGLVKKSTSGAQVNFGASEVQDAYVDDSSVIYTDDDDTRIWARSINDSTATASSITGTWGVDTFHKIKIVAKSSSDVDYHLKDSSTADLTHTTNIPNEPIGLVMNKFIGDGEQSWSFARKYTATEPTWEADSGERHQLIVSQFV